jgi:hypothetical protein
MRSTFCSMRLRLLLLTLLAAAASDVDAHAFMSYPVSRCGAAVRSRRRQILLALAALAPLSRSGPCEEAAMHISAECVFLHVHCWA